MTDLDKDKGKKTNHCKLIDIAAASERLGVTVSTLYSWTHMRRVPYYKIGRLVRFSEAELDEWVSKRKVEVHKFWSEQT